MTRRKSATDHYATLHVHPRADQDVIRAAYRALEKINAGDDSVALAEAYDVLSDPRAFPLYVDEVQRGFELECWALGRPVMLSSGSDADVSVADTVGRVDGLAAA